MRLPIEFHCFTTVLRVRVLRPIWASFGEQLCQGGAAASAGLGACYSSNVLGLQLTERTSGRGDNEPYHHRHSGCTHYHPAIHRARSGQRLFFLRRPAR